MKRFLLFLAAGGPLIAWLLWTAHVEHSPNAEPISVAQADSALKSKLENPNSKLLAPTSAEVSHLADDLNSPQTDIHGDLRIVAEILGHFRSNFPHSGNPVGDNAEITAALTGKNKLHLALIPPGHPAINAAGELCDRWGTPLFFHAESSAYMEVRSAGPDKKLWTDDDVVLAP